MSRRYAPEFKQLVLAHLDAQAGHIAVTSRLTGVPQRTIRQWRQERRSLLPPPAPPARRQLEFESDLDALAFIRQQIMSELVAIADALAVSAPLESPHQRVQALSNLLDRLMKLDAHLKPYRPAQQTFRIEFQDPDGSVHVTPPWLRDEEDADSAGWN